MTPVVIAQAVIDGLLMGGIYSLVALGLTLIFGVMKIINFSQGAFLMVGMYVAYWAFEMFGLNPYLAIPLSALVLFLLGGFFQKTVLERLGQASEHAQLLVTFGAMLILENAALAMWSPDYRHVSIPALQNAWHVAGLTFDKPKTISFLCALALTGIFYMVLQHTYLGKAIRGTSSDSVGAALSGIRVPRMNFVAFGLGAACSGIAGALLTPFFDTFPTVGQIFIYKAFVVVVLGGLGNFIGALAGGLLIGICESLGGLWLPGTLKEMIVYVIFVLVLLFRPTGLFRGSVQ